MIRRSDTRRTEAGFTAGREAAAGVEQGGIDWGDDLMTDDDSGLRWAICRRRIRPGGLVTRFDLCHVTHTTRRAAEGCGIRTLGAPELVAVRRDADRGQLYRVIVSLSHMASGRVRAAVRT